MKRKKFFLPDQRKLFKGITKELLDSGEFNEEHIRTFLIRVNIKFRDRYSGKILKCFNMDRYNDLMFEFLQILHELGIKLDFEQEPEKEKSIPLDAFRHQRFHEVRLGNDY